MIIKKLASGKEIMEGALRRSTRTSISVHRKSALARKKVIEAKKMSIIEGFISEKLSEFVKEYPSISALPDFQREMFDTLIDVDKTRMALGHLRKTEKLIQKIKRECTKRCFSAGNDKEAERAEKQFIARASSVMERVEGSINEINNSSRKLREIPEIKEDCVNVLLAGFPNVGKTTMLKRLTGSEAEIASYPFTTKRMNLGYFDDRYVRFQVMDTPGLLDKSLKKMNNIEKKTILALKHLAHVIVFIIDPSSHSGFSLEAQTQLLLEMRKAFDKEFIVVLNKADLCKPEQLDEALSAVPGAIIEGGGKTRELITATARKSAKKAHMTVNPEK